ncbi:MAG: helix-turn-helix domain-containing protein [Marinobacter sp.]
MRKCRLNLAWHYLEQGYSVQQAAHRSGYRHATNFATAFRRQFGVSPKTVV